MKRVVITGMGVISPLGNDPQVMFDNILKKTCAIKPITHFDTKDFRVKLAAEAEAFEDESLFKQSDLRFNDRFTQFARIAGKRAYLQSGLEDVMLDRDRFGVIFGTGIAGIGSMEKAKENLDQRGPSRIFPHFIPMTIVNAAAAMIAIDLQAYGPCIPVVTGCAAGSDAIGEAYLKIKHGLLDVALAGASEASITPLGVGGFMAMRALYEGSDPTTASIPFDRLRSGFVMGEGAGALILEEYAHAKNRNATILAELVGYGSTCDAYHITAPQEEGTMIAKAMSNAINDADILPADIDYINAHGTSTQLNDVIESRAIQKTLGKHKDTVFVSSTKSHMGHLLGACGAVEAIVCIKVLEHGIIPATIHTKDIADTIQVNVVIGENIHHATTYTMSNSLGFGGHNASLIFKRYTDHES